MTLYFWDCSDFDWPKGPVDLVAAKGAGLTGFTHKATEGTSIRHKHFGEGVKRARDAGLPFVGAYMVPRTPGDGGNGTVSQQVDYFLAYVKSDAPWLLTHPGGFFQMDTETWPYDHVSGEVGHEAAVLLKQKSGLTVIEYASKGEYGASVPTTEPLWNANYPNATSIDMKIRYAQCGGSSGPGWKAYGTPPRMPSLWQYCGGAVTIGTQPKCDASAYEGTESTFYTLIGKGEPMTTATDLDVLLHTDGQLKNFPSRFDATTNKFITWESGITETYELINTVNVGLGKLAGAISTLTTMVEAIPTETVPAAPLSDADVDRIAVAVLSKLNLVQKV